MKSRSPAIAIVLSPAAAVMVLGACGVSPQASPAPPDAVGPGPAVGQASPASAAGPATQSELAMSISRTLQIDTAALSADELATHIDQAVSNVLDVGQLAADAVTAATADGSVAQAEVDSLTTAVSLADRARAGLFRLTGDYFDHDQDVSESALNAMARLESDFGPLDASLQAISDVLPDAVDALQEGQAVPSETIDDLKQASQAARAAIATLRQRSPN